MADERNRVLAGECISRAQVGAVGAVEPIAIDAAIDACDYERAALYAIACAPVPVDVVARILPGIELPAITCALIAIADGDRARLLDLLERKRFPQTKDASELEAIVLYAAWRAAAPAARVIPELRRLAARSMTAEGYALLATIAQAIDDPNVSAACKPIASFAKEYAKQVAADERAMTAKPADVIASLPAEVETTRAAGFTVRAAAQVGRNDPCPCGSGLKYKKCCADKPERQGVAPSPVPGVSWDDFLVGDRMTADHVGELLLRDLARVDLGKLADEPLFAMFDRFLRAHEWRHAARATDELATRAAKRADEAREDLVVALLDCGELALARAHVAKLPAELAKLFALELAIADGPAAAWPALVDAAQHAAASADKLPSIDLAYGLLRAAPALGIVAARACIGTLHVDDPDLMLELVEDARDRLNLPPNDAAWDVLDELTVKKPKPDGEDATELRTALHESSTKIDQLERSLATMRGELDDARTRPAAELMRAPEDPGGLDAKVRELEALIREGNAERRELRQQLQTSQEPRRTRPDERPRRTTADEPDEGFADEPPVGTRGVTLPRFDRRFADALSDVPAPVASEAMRTIGTLAAGDGFAWRAVKQAKDMARQVLMARVGIHHRLLFRVEDGALDVLDLITREQLMTTLKRLRGAR